MITDNQTNTVYFSNLIPEDFPKQFAELARIIESAGYQGKIACRNLRLLLPRLHAGAGCRK